MAGLVALLLAACLLAIVLANRLRSPLSGPAAISGPADLPGAGDVLTLTTWNLGYAGLGADSDFIADKGRSVLAPSRAAVARNLAGIREVLESDRSDVLLLQEVAEASPLNYGADMLAALGPVLAGRQSLFDAEVETRLVPWPLRLRQGAAVVSRRAISSAEIVPLPRDGKPYLGLLPRLYRLQVIRLAGGAGARQWAIVHLHLAAFDGDGALRREQLESVLALCTRLHAEGHHVVAGGDWNLEVVKDAFAHATDERFRFWLRPFPAELVPAGWTLAFDRTVASVRTLQEPYREGHTYRTVIDGFLCSPDVEVVALEGRDLGFRHSDHQPVRASLRIRAGGKAPVEVP